MRQLYSSAPRRWGVSATVAAVLAALAIGGPGVRAQSNPGLATACADFRVALLPFGLGSFDIADEGWVWVEPNGRRLRSVTGRVVRSHVATADTPSNHDSHDMDPSVVVDPGQEDIMSIAVHSSSDTFA